MNYDCSYNYFAHCSLSRLSKVIPIAMNVCRSYMTYQITYNCRFKTGFRRVSDVNAQHCNTATLLCDVMKSFIVAFSGFWNTAVLLLSLLRFSQWLLLRYFAPCRFNVSYEIMSVFKVFDSSALQLRQGEFYCF